MMQNNENQNVTKEELQQIRGEFRTALEQNRTEFRSSLNQGLTGLEQRLNERMDQKFATKVELARMESHIIRWVVGLLLAQTALLFTAFGGYLMFLDKV